MRIEIFKKANLGLIKQSGKVALLISSSLLWACSPHFDWREISNLKAGYSALFPGRPYTTQRNILLPTSIYPTTAPFTLTLQTATIGKTLFTIGYATLPTSSINAEQWPYYFANAILTNLNAHIIQSFDVLAPRAYDIVAQGYMPTNKFRPNAIQQKQMHDIPMKIRAQFYLHHNILYEILVIAPEAEWDPAAVDIFLTGFKLYVP